MSFSGKKTPLLLNAESQLNQNQGFKINAIAAAYHGVWTPSTPYVTPTTGSYSQGTLTSNTVLYNLTRALPIFYNLAPSSISVQTFRNLLQIGRPIDGSYPTVNCPALGNCRPDTFKTSYAGWGSFKSGKLTDSFYNEITSAVLGLVEPTYPPKNYPVDGSSSYIYNNWSSLTPPAGATQPYQYLHEYAWVTGWPGAYSWQSKTSGNPQEAVDPVTDGDSYAAAYFPRPDLAGSEPWRSRDANKIEYDEYFRNGFLATIPRQAYYEFWSNYTTRRNNQYVEFIKSIQQVYQYQSTTNQKIASFANTKTFIKGNFSNINDLTTSDIAGVSLALKDFGNDMIRLGKSLDLSNIHLFGLPSKFLLNLQKYNALTEALKFALLYSELTIVELDSILLPTYTPSISQEKKIYNALQIIQGNDLNDIKIIVNCTTDGLTTLADLINPQKMFPNSYASLTVPQYNIETPSSKIYDFIYLGNGVNSRIQNWGDYLIGILPSDLATACGAFMMTMNQIKNIRQMEAEKLSQVISNLEVTNKGLPLINSVSGTPGNVEAANVELAQLALGSGGAGTFLYCDFMGALSGHPYVEYYQRVESLINLLQTSTLRTIYQNLYNLAVDPTPPTSLQVQTLINAANAEILNIQNNNPEAVSQLNYWWNKIGTQLWIEQRAIPLSIPKNDLIYQSADKSNIDSFIRSLEDYALKTDSCEIAQVLEAIADVNTLGGQSIIAAMREARNAKRLINTGGELDNDVPDQINKNTATAVAEIVTCPGPIANIEVTGAGSGYNQGNPPKVVILPQTGVFGTGRHAETALNISTDCTFKAVIANYPEIVNVKVGWISGYGTVTSATTVGPNYEITVTGQCFDKNVLHTFYSPTIAPGAGATAQAVVDSNGSIARIEITNPGNGYCEPPIIIIQDPPTPARLGDAIVPGSFAGSPYTGPDPVPPNLVTNSDASYSQEEAINEVTICNCDCWQE